MLKLGRGRSLNISRWVGKDAKLLDISSRKPVTCRMKQKVGDVLEPFAKKHRRLPVLDDKGHVRGMLAATDVLKALGGWKKGGKTRPKDRLAVKVKDVMSSHIFHLDKNAQLPAVLSFFRHHRRGAYPVLYRKSLLGMVTEWDIVRQIRGKTGVKVSDIMVRKPLVAQENYNVTDVAKMLCLGGFRRLPVVKKGILLGIVTPRDILRFLHEKNIPGKLEGQKQSVKSVMERRVAATGPNQDVYDVVKIIVGNKIGGLPVIEDRELLGIITERDIVDAVEI